MAELSEKLDIYTLIACDHASLRTMAQALVDLELENKHRLAAAFADFREELVVQFRAQEKTLYAALIQHPTVREEAMYGINEHEELEHMLSQLDMMEMDGQEWLPWFVRLKQMLEHHMRLEEEALFFLARDVISEEQAYGLARAMLAQKIREHDCYRMGESAIAA